ncbi:MAG: SIMPL domain-containing protein [bacterium]
MTKKLLITILGLTMIFTAITAKAQPPAPDNRAFVNVQGTAKENYPPDTANITFAIEVNSKDVKQATQKNAQASEKVINAVKKYIDTTKGEKIKTSNYNVTPSYDYNKNSNRNTITGYTVTNQITVTSKRIKNAGEIIDTAIENGANRVDNLSFSLEDDQNFATALIKKATIEAYSNAQATAEALGYKVNGVKDITVSTSRQQPYASNIYFEAKKASVAGYSTPIEAGDTTVNALVQANFFIDKK